MSALAILVLLASACATTEAATFDQITIGQYAEDFTKIDQFLSGKPYFFDAELIVHSIQADLRVPGNLLVAVGNAIYSVDEDGMTEVLIGRTEAGNANGPAQSSEFNITASFVQLDSSTLLISDQGNRCIRKFDRFSKQVSEYAGSCDPTQRFYSRASYKPWEAFNSPSRMLLVDNQVVILDRVGSDSLIVSKDLNSGLVNTIWDVGNDATDFVYEPTYKSYIVTERVGVYNVTVDEFNNANKHFLYYLSSVTTGGVLGLSLSDDLLYVADKSRGVVEVASIKNKDTIFTLCDSHSDFWSMPYCNIDSPTAVATINGYIYFSHSPVTFSSPSGSGTVRAYLYRVSYSLTGEVTTAMYTDSGNSYDSSYGASAGSTALIVIVVIVAVAVKIGLIVLCVWRWSRRVAYRRYQTNTTVVTVAQPTTTVVQSSVPYGRLQEPYPPPAQFPPPPSYSMNQHQAPPAYSHVGSKY